MLYTADVENIKNILIYINNTKTFISSAYTALNGTQSEFKIEFIKILDAMDNDLDNLFDAVQNVVNCVDESGIVS